MKRRHLAVAFTLLALVMLLIPTNAAAQVGNATVVDYGLGRALDVYSPGHPSGHWMWVGQFLVDVDFDGDGVLELDDAVAWCPDVDLPIELGDPGEAEIDPPSNTQPWLAIGYICSNYTATTDDEAAAIQLAIWKLMEGGMSAVTTSNSPINTAANAIYTAAFNQTGTVPLLITPLVNLPGNPAADIQRLIICQGCDCDLKIEKRHAVTNELLGGATFTITPNPWGGSPDPLTVIDGGPNDPDVSANGIIELENVDCAVEFTIEETVAPPGDYEVDPTPQSKTSACGPTVFTFINAPCWCDIRIEKRDAPGELLGGATFTVSPNPYGVGTLTVVDNDANDDNTDPGIIELWDVPCDVEYTITETVAPTGYVVDPAPQSKTPECDVPAVFIFTNEPCLCDILIEKHDPTGVLLEGATFTVSPNPYDGGTLTVVDNDGNDDNTDPGIIELWDVPCVEYTVTETVAPTGYTVDPSPQIKTPACDDPAVFIFVNSLPCWCDIEIRKVDESQEIIDLPGATFKIDPNPYDGGTLTVVDNDANDGNTDPGIIELGDVPCDVEYTITEVAAPTGYVADPTPQSKTPVCDVPAVFTFTNTPRECPPTGNSLRVYGRSTEDAAFPYTKPNGPFSPQHWEAPPKDFIEWNPAYMNYEDEQSNGVYGSFFGSIAVNGNPGNEKVHLRQWYVPKYQEPRGWVWTCQAPSYTPDIVKEYTYLMLDLDNNPYPGRPGETTFVFPIADNDDDQYGLDDYDMNGDGAADIVFLESIGEVDDSETGPPFDTDIGCRWDPVAGAFETGIPAGTRWIDLSTGQFTVEAGDVIRFLDHVVEITAVGVGAITTKVWYSGNSTDDSPSNINVPVSYTLSGGRHLVTVEDLRADNLAPGEPSPPNPPSQSEAFVAGTAALKLVKQPWWLQVINVGDTSAEIKVGRLITEGETFFVDGAEYDVAMLWFAPSPNEEDGLKFITIRNPLPKVPVTLQALTLDKYQVLPCPELIPALPPFNMLHDMIDDINIPEVVQGDPDTVIYPDMQNPDNEISESDLYDTPAIPEQTDGDPDGYGDVSGIHMGYNTIAERRVQDVEPDCECWVREEKELRFDTNLLEEKFYDEAWMDPRGPEEEWQWQNIETLPWDYTEFLLPELPEATGLEAMGYIGDYILVSSWATEDSIWPTFTFTPASIAGGTLTIYDTPLCTMIEGRLYGAFNGVPEGRLLRAGFWLTLDTGSTKYTARGQFEGGVTHDGGLVLEGKLFDYSGPRDQFPVNVGQLALADGDLGLSVSSNENTITMEGLAIFPVRTKFVHDTARGEVWSADIYINDAAYNDLYHDINEMSLRVYGRSTKDAAFPYADPNGPFSPQSDEAPPEDFIEWNPAYMYHLDGASAEVYGTFFRSIVVNGNDANEKVHLRQWYVPKYQEPRGWVWTEQTPVEAPHIIKEYTYLLLDTQNDPQPGRPGATRFALPISDNDDTQCGLDDYDVNGDGEANIVFLESIGWVDDSETGPPFDTDLGWRWDPVAGAPETGIPAGTRWIDISTGQLAVEQGDVLRYLDHTYEITAVDVSSITVTVQYSGNSADDTPTSISVPAGQTLSAGRELVHVEELTANTVAPGEPSPPNPPSQSEAFVAGTSNLQLAQEPAYLQMINSTGTSAQVKVGRLITEGETFFVDGAEYDVAMLWFAPSPSGEPGLKFITIRNPLSKVPVTLDTLANETCQLLPCPDAIPMLPPFNMEHDMIDDVNIPDRIQGDPDCEVYPDEQNRDNYVSEPDANLDGYGDFSGLDIDYNTIAKRRIQDVPPIDECWIVETKEPRFDTNLLEEKFYPMQWLVSPSGSLVLDLDDDEEWEWKNIETLPWDYTEFVLPTLPEATGLGVMGDYILVSSFMTQDWFTAVWQDESPDGYVAPVRVKFNYDAAFLPGDKSGIYINIPGSTPTVPEEPCDYDNPLFGGNGNGVIDKSDAINAIIHYFGGVIDKTLAIQVIIYYFGQTEC